MVAPIILAAGGTAASSATKDGGIINTLLKAAFIIAIFGVLILGFMWVTGEFSLEAITQMFASWYKATFETFVMKYTPLGWAISGASAVLSFFTGKMPTWKKLKFW
jgi:hypothetical protein